MTLLHRLFRRLLIVVSATAAAVVATVTIAMAVNLTPGTSYIGQSKHHHYTINLLPECFTSGCTRATTIGIQITTGNAKRPAARCVYGTFQLANAKLHRGKFSAKGQFLAANKLFTLAVSGKFVSAHRAYGTITGPKRCGGVEGFRVTGPTTGG